MRLEYTPYGAHSTATDASLMPQTVPAQMRLKIAALSNDGRYVALSGDVGLETPPFIMVLDARSGQLFARGWLPGSGGVVALAFSGTAQEVFAIESSGFVCAFDLQTTGLRCGRVDIDADQIAIANDASWFATIGREYEKQRLLIWRASGGDARVIETPYIFRELFISPDNRRLASWDDEGAVCIWDLEDPSPSCRSVPSPPEREIYRQASAFTPDGGIVAAGRAKIDWIDLDTFTHELHDAPDTVFSKIAPLLGGRALAVHDQSTFGAHAYLFSERGRRFRPLRVADVVASTPDGARGIVASAYGDALEINSWEGDTGTLTGTIAIERVGVEHVAMISDHVAVFASGRRLWAFDSTTGAVVSVLEAHGDIESLSPDGRMLIARDRAEYVVGDGDARTYYDIYFEPWDVVAGTPFPPWSRDSSFTAGGLPPLLTCSTAKGDCAALINGETFAEANSSSTYAELPLIETEPLQGLFLRAVALSANGSRAARVFRGAPARQGHSLIEVWKTMEGREARRIQVPGSVENLALDGVGARLLSLSDLRGGS